MHPSSFPLGRRRQRAFTLIELMVGVAVVGILLAVAVPGFQSQMQKSRRVDAMNALATAQQAQERWRGNNISYAASLATLGLGAATADGYYTLAVSGASATGYTLTATAVAGKSQARDTACSALKLTVVRGDATTGPAGCWSK
jgi:type IV pilus assembly protein PilE